MPLHPSLTRRLARWSCLLATLAATSDAGVTYQYDDAGRLRSVTFDDGASVTYQLDAAGNRVTVNSLQAPPGLRLGSATYTLSEVSGSSVTVTVTRGGNAAPAVSVSYSATAGTAAAGTDFGTPSGTGTLSWAANDTATKSFTVPVVHDTIHEGNEQFTVALTSPTGGAVVLAPSQATVTITDNDSPPSFSINSPSISEAGGNMVFTVTKTGGTSMTHAVSYATANGTATAGSDYTAASGVLTFAASEASKTFTVPITNNTTWEGASEAFTATLSAPTNGATLGTATGTGTINEDDPTPTFTVNDVTVVEGSSTISFTVTKTGATQFSHAITVATANGSATAGSDYTAASVPLTFTTAQTAQLITILLANDTTFEGTETFTINLSAPTNGAIIGDATGVGTITENDAAPYIDAVMSNEVTEGVAITVNIYKGNSTALSHSVSYTTSNGTAAAGSDYTAVSGSVTFAPGETNKFVTINTIDDAVSEPGETFSFSISSPTNGAVLLASGTTSTTIVDNDNVPSTPPNVRVVPDGTAYGGIFSIEWDLPTGPVAYYEVEENGAPPYYRVDAPQRFKTFSYPTTGSANYFYRVRACSATNQCSVFSGDVFVTTCPEWGCP